MGKRISARSFSSKIASPRSDFLIERPFSTLKIEDSEVVINC